MSPRNFSSKRNFPFLYRKEEGEEQRFRTASQTRDPDRSKLPYPGNTGYILNSFPSASRCLLSPLSVIRFTNLRPDIGAKKTLIARLIAKTAKQASKQAHRAGCISHDKRNCTVTERQLTAPFSRTNGPALPVSSPLPVHGQTRNGVDGAHGGVAVDALYLSVILRGPASPMQIRQRWITHSMHKL